MNKVSHTNETTRFQHVGGVTIPPGETRDVDPSLLPDYQPEGVAVEEEEIDQVAELLKVNVKLIMEQLAHMSDDQLAHAVSLEQAGQNRKTLIEAMTAENLRRATDRAGA